MTDVHAVGIGKHDSSVHVLLPRSSESEEDTMDFGEMLAQRGVAAPLTRGLPAKPPDQGQS